MIPALTDAIVNLDTTFWVTSGAIVLLLVLSAFFSGSETALTAASRAKLRAQADKGSRRADRALNLTRDPERLIGSVLLGNNLVNILAASLATALFTRLFGDGGVALATLVMTLLVLIFAEVMPKTYAITDPERAATRVAPIISPMVVLFSPVVGAIRWYVRLTLRAFGLRTDPSSPILAVQEEIAGAIELGHSEGAVQKEHRDRLLGALDLGNRTVDEVMLHRSGIETINADDPPEEVLEQCLESAHTRLPLWQGNPENIVGVVHAKALLRSLNRLRRENGEGDVGPALEGFNILDVAMEPYFVPETSTLDDQMREFLRRHTHFALVVDEYGDLQGLVTLEDILEEIVGEIADEHDLEEPQIPVKNAQGMVEVDGSMTIRDLNRAMDWHLPEDEANTVAGLVIHEAQAIPTVGQVFSFHGYRFEIMGRENNRISKLAVRPL